MKVAVPVQKKTCSCIPRETCCSITRDTIVHKIWVLNRRIATVKCRYAKSGPYPSVTKSSAVIRLGNLKLKSSYNSTFTRAQFHPFGRERSAGSSGSAHVRHWSGMPGITPPVQNRYIWVFHLRNRTVTATTSYNHLSKEKRKTPYIGPCLAQIHRSARVHWCHTLRVWTLRNLLRIWFSDE